MKQHIDQWESRIATYLWLTYRFETPDMAGEAIPLDRQLFCTFGRVYCVSISWYPHRYVLFTYDDVDGEPFLLAPDARVIAEDGETQTARGWCEAITAYDALAGEL